MKLQVDRGHLLSNWNETLLFDLPAIGINGNSRPVFKSNFFFFCLVRPQAENMSRELSWWI